jgi:hypothetical protein
MSCDNDLSVHVAYMNSICSIIHMSTIDTSTAHMYTIPHSIGRGKDRGGTEREEEGEKEGGGEEELGRERQRKRGKRELGSSHPGLIRTEIQRSVGNNSRSSCTLVKILVSKSDTFDSLTALQETQGLLRQTTQTRKRPTNPTQASLCPARPPPREPPTPPLRARLPLGIQLRMPAEGVLREPRDRLPLRAPLGFQLRDPSEALQRRREQRAVGRRRGMRKVLGWCLVGRLRTLGGIRDRRRVLGRQQNPLNRTLLQVRRCGLKVLRIV